MQRTDYDFDVIAGPSTPPPQPPAQPAPQTPRGGEAQPASGQTRG